MSRCLVFCVLSLAASFAVFAESAVIKAERKSGHGAEVRVAVDQQGRTVSDKEPQRHAFLHSGEGPTRQPVVPKLIVQLPSKDLGDELWENLVDSSFDEIEFVKSYTMDCKAWSTLERLREMTNPFFSDDVKTQDVMSKEKLDLMRQELERQLFWNGQPWNPYIQYGPSGEPVEVPIFIHSDAEDVWWNQIPKTEIIDRLVTVGAPVVVNAELVCWTPDACESKQELLNNQTVRSVYDSHAKPGQNWFVNGGFLAGDARAMRYVNEWRVWRQFQQNRQFTNDQDSVHFFYTAHLLHGDARGDGLYIMKMDTDNLLVEVRNDAM